MSTSVSYPDFVNYAVPLFIAAEPFQLADDRAVVRLHSKIAIGLSLKA